MEKDSAIVEETNMIQFHESNTEKCNGICSDLDFVDNEKRNVEHSNNTESKLIEDNANYISNSPNVDNLMVSSKSDNDYEEKPVNSNDQFTYNNPEQFNNIGSRIIEDNDSNTSKSSDIENLKKSNRKRLMESSESESDKDNDHFTGNKPQNVNEPESRTTEDDANNISNSSDVDNFKESKKRLMVLSESEDNEEETPKFTDDNQQHLSRSESETIPNNTPNSPDGNKAKKSNRKRLMVLSESEDDHEEETPKFTDDNQQHLNATESGMNPNFTTNIPNSPDVYKAKKSNTKRLMALSDSEDEIEGGHSKFDDNSLISKSAPIYKSNDKGELVLETGNSAQKSLLADLCDSEDSDQDNENISQNLEEKSAPIPYKRVKSKTNAPDKPKKMTGREAAELRKEIRSESQRMVREKNVSLPYHKPKSYTLKEFLEKRAKLTCALSSSTRKAPPSIAMKMTRDQLEIVSKKLDKRIKEVEEFYKSESDESENELDGISSCITDWLNVLVNNAVDSVVNYTGIENKETESPQAISMELGDSIDDVVNNVIEEQSKTVEEHLITVDETIELNKEFLQTPQNEKKLNKLELLKKLGNSQPKLSGSPHDVIDLDESVTKSKGITKLMERFFQHTSKKHLHKHEVKLNVINVNKGEICSETISMTVDEEESIPDELPGVRFKKMRQDLQNQMAQIRTEIWQQKKLNEESQSDQFKDTYDGERSDCGAEIDILDDEEEDAEYDDETSSEEEEEIELEYSEKPKKKSEFVDDEAEESDIEDDNDVDDILEQNDNEDPDMKTESIKNDDTEENGDKENLKPDDNKEVVESSPKKKVLRRILQTFNDDDDDSDDGHEIQLLKPNHFTKESEQLDSTISLEEDTTLPPNLLITSPRYHSTKTKSDLDFLTPVSYLTGLQNLNSDSKFLKEPQIVSPFKMPLEISPVDGTKGQATLNLEISQNSNDQTNLEDLTQLCSGKFPSTQIVDSQLSNNENNSQAYSTQDLLNVCSGEFTGITELNSNETNKNLESNNKSQTYFETNPVKELKNLDKDSELMITQLLDEEEMEQFKKKFDSPQLFNSKNEINEVNATGLIQSDDENDELEITKKKKRQRKLVFSDESSDDDQENEDNNDEEIDLHDDNSLDEKTDKPRFINEDVEYDSEENEITTTNDVPTYKPSDFFENEAELSESEWGSDDEDEKGLDTMDFEQGDNEEFDENKIRQDIERIHMRKMLDDDNHQVKILQELLLEDGELHGSGRQRQFKWKNIDSVDNEGDNKPEEDNVNNCLDDEESEEQWRKMRHQREIFLKQKSNSEMFDDDDNSIINDSQVLRIGQKAIIKNKSINNTPIEKTNNLTPKEPFTLLNKKGSFLSRSEQALQKLAEYNKITTSVNSVTTKNSRNFVFQTIETSSESKKITLIEQKKRKATDGTPNAIKKLRISNLSPAINKKKLEKPERAKKLFDNW